MSKWEILTEQYGDNKGYIYLNLKDYSWYDSFTSSLRAVIDPEYKWNWVDYNLHLTLAYSPNVTDQELMAGLSAAVGHNAIKLSVTGVSSFENADTGKKVVYLQVDKQEELIALQTSIYNALVAAGVELAETSNPEQWIPHVVVALTEIETETPQFSTTETYWCSKVCMGRDDYSELGSVKLRWDSSHDEVETGSAPASEQVEEVEEEKENTQVSEQSSVKEHIRLTLISEMKGNPPKINLPKDINIEDLQKDYNVIFGERELEFVTLPVGEINAESRNGRTYPETPVKELVEQINSLRPEGMWGHLSEEEFATRYDPPAIRWLAAKIDEKTGLAWAKGLPLTVEAANYYRLARATNSKVGTSITAMAEIKNNVVQHIELNTIDIADPRRVGILSTVALPTMTSEQVGSDMDEIPEDSKHDVFVKVREQEEITDNSKELKKMELEMQVQELTAERDSLKTNVSEFETKFNEANAELEAITAREQAQAAVISELLNEYIVNEVREQVKVVSARNLVKNMVVEQKPMNRDAVKTALETVLAREDVVEILKAGVATEMGPNQPAQQGNPVNNSGVTPANKYFNIPEIQ